MSDDAFSRALDALMDRAVRAAIDPLEARLVRIEEMLRSLTTPGIGAVAQSRHLTPEEAGQAVGFTAQTMRRKFKRGDIPGAMQLPGGDWRITQAALDAWVRQQAAATKGELVANDEIGARVSELMRRRPRKAP